MLTVSFVGAGDTMIIELEGDINVDASNFVEAIGWSLAKGFKKIICDFDEVNIVDYVGVSLIAVGYKNVINHKAQLRICRVPGHVARIFTVVGLDRVFDFYTERRQALKSFQDDKRIGRILSRKFRRRFKRIAVSGLVEYRRKGSFDDTFYRGAIINISAIGIFVDARQIFPVGEILTTKILAGDLKLQIDTRVVWIGDDQIQSFDRHSMGLEFYHIDAAAQGKIIEFVDRHVSRAR